MNKGKHNVACIAVITILAANGAVAFDPIISRADDGAVSIEFRNNRIGDVSDALSKAFRVRVCAEDFGVIGPPFEDRNFVPPDNPDSLAPGKKHVVYQFESRDDILAKSAEAGGPLRLGEEPGISGVYTSASLDQMLEDITRPLPYTWLKSKECYVIYPRNGSLLLERISVTVPPGPLAEVCETILSSRSAESAKVEPIHPMYSIGGSGPIPDPMKAPTLGTLTFVDTSLMEALCRTVEAVDPSVGDGFYIWQLCSGAARECRFLDPRWVSFWTPFPNSQVSRPSSRPDPEYFKPKMSLSGPWAFRLDPANQGIAENWQQAALPDTITLPGSTDQAGYGTENPERRVAYLSRLWEYAGPAWYQREVVIPENWAGKHVTLFLERAHWETQVWVDHAKVGMCDSLCVPHVYDLSAWLTPGPHRLTLRVDNAIKYNVGINAHSITEHTQTNWNGLAGRLKLRAQDPVYIKSVTIYPDLSKREAKVLVTIGNDTEAAATGTVRCDALPPPGAPRDIAVANTSFNAAPGQETNVELILRLGENIQLWDEFSPALYHLIVAANAQAKGGNFGDTLTTRFGMREMGQVGTHIAINGRPIMIRGTLECCIFPLTGYPATDVAAWKRMYDIARSYGLNHFRFHSWCPPEAAFDAADEAGFTLHVETPVWTELGSDTNTDLFIHEEANRILAAYGNHPSFCMMAVGNEPSGPKKGEFLREIVWEWKQKDPRRLYTTCAGWPELPLSNYHVVHQRWDKPYRLHGGPLRPDTMVDYFEVIKDAPIPVIAHELGQWCVYPSYEEIPKYTGALRARNLEVFRESLDAHHMLDQAQAFSQASGALQTLMYKADIEAILRTPGTGGYQLLQLQDFPGQGSALMGFLDAFWDSKGYCTPEQFREFCSETVPLLRLEKFIWINTETLTAEAEISHFGPAALAHASPVWTITSNGREVVSGKMPVLDIPLGNGTPLGELHVDLSAVTAPAQYTVTLALEGTPWRNHWDFWVYPAVVDPAPPAEVLLATEWTPEVADALEKGGKVLLLPGYLAPGCSVLSAFEPVFWNMQWFPGQRRQLGILCDPEHPAFEQFPTDRHTNWQWWDLLNKSRAMNLDSFPPDFRPFLQVIDDWNTNRRLGFAFEARVANGKLLVCSLDLANGLDQRPAARQLRHSLFAYLAGDQFNPAATLEPAAVQALFLRPDVEVAKVDSEATGYEGVKAIDGDPATAWHTPWGAGSPGFPHEIQLRLKTERPVAGLRYLPRQDVANGHIAKYEVYVSPDGQDWGRPVAKGKFEKGPAGQLVRFEKPVTGRYVRLVALSDFAGDSFLAVAELEVLGEL